MGNAGVGAVPCMARRQGNKLHLVSVLVEDVAQLIQHFIPTKPIASVPRQINYSCVRVMGREQRLAVGVLLQHLVQEKDPSLPILLGSILRFCFGLARNLVEEEVEVSLLLT